MTMADRDSRSMYDDLFAGMSLSEGKTLSKTERKRRGWLGDKALIYGEVGRRRGRSRKIRRFLCCCSFFFVPISS